MKINKVDSMLKLILHNVSNRFDTYMNKTVERCVGNLMLEMK